MSENPPYTRLVRAIEATGVTWREACDDVGLTRMERCRLKGVDTDRGATRNAALLVLAARAAGDVVDVEVLDWPGLEATLEALPVGALHGARLRKLRRRAKRKPEDIVAAIGADACGTPPYRNPLLWVRHVEQGEVPAIDESAWTGATSATFDDGPWLEAYRAGLPEGVAYVVDCALAEFGADQTPVEVARRLEAGGYPLGFGAESIVRARIKLRT